MPTISEYYLNNNVKQISLLVKKLIAAILSISIPILLLGHFLGNWGLSILFGESILIYSYLLVPTFLNVICTAFVYFFNSIIISFRKSRVIYISSIVAIILCVIFTPILVNYSLNGASYALIVTQIGQIIVLAIAYIIFKQKSKVQSLTIA